MKSQGPILKEIFLKDYQGQTDTLMQKHGVNKDISTDFKLPALVALSHYPELKNAKIIFVEKPIKTTMACRPTWFFFLHRRENRTYKIYVNNNPAKIKGAMLGDVPFNAQVGLIGHELAHVVDYARSGTFKILSLGFNYLFTRGRVHIERRVDRITIAHNLGWQLYDFGDFILNRSNVLEEYKMYKRRVYYSPEEILGLIQGQ
jgi:hypothetical protein